jgi:hypothetical protein
MAFTHLALLIRIEHLLSRMYFCKPKKKGGEVDMVEPHILADNASQPPAKRKNLNSPKRLALESVKFLITGL